MKTIKFEWLRLDYCVKIKRQAVPSIDFLKVLLKRIVSNRAWDKIGKLQMKLCNIQNLFWCYLERLYVPHLFWLKVTSISSQWSSYFIIGSSQLAEQWKKIVSFELYLLFLSLLSIINMLGLMYSMDSVLFDQLVILKWWHIVFRTK